MGPDGLRYTSYAPAPSTHRLQMHRQLCQLQDELSNTCRSSLQGSTAVSAFQRVINRARQGITLGGGRLVDHRQLSSNNHGARCARWGTIVVSYISLLVARHHRQAAKDAVQSRSYHSYDGIAEDDF